MKFYYFLFFTIVLFSSCENKQKTQTEKSDVIKEKVEEKIEVIYVSCVIEGQLPKCVGCSGWQKPNKWVTPIVELYSLNEKQQVMQLDMLEDRLRGIFTQLKVNSREIIFDRSYVKVSEKRRAVLNQPNSVSTDALLY